MRVSLKSWGLSLLGLVVGFFFLVPYLQMFLTALKPSDQLMAIPADYLPSKWNWSNFIKAWQVAPIATFLRNTWLIAFFATLIVVLISIPAAYYLARHSFRGRGLFMLLVLVTQMFSPTALVIGIYREVMAFGITNSFIALILVNAAFNMAFSVWILSSFFAGIPREIEEAAELDGCSRVGTLRRVVIPLATPGIVTAIIFTFIAAWNEFVIALTLTTGQETQPITVGLTSFIGQYTVQWNYLFAATLVAIVPVVILFAFIERWLVGGLTAGGVK